MSSIARSNAVVEVWGAPTKSKNPQPPTRRKEAQPKEGEKGFKPNAEDKEWF